MPSAAADDETLDASGVAPAAPFSAARTRSVASSVAAARDADALMRDYAELTKPGITMLVLITTFVGFVAGSGPGDLPFVTLLVTLAGTYLVVAGASALNHVIEAGPDALMRRTRQRPLPARRMTIDRALAFGLSLTAIGLVLLAAGGAGMLAAFITGLSWLLYVLVYTPLKRVTTAATIIGAVPGALPPVIGWTAASGQLGAGAWVLFGILFLWQFPHFLALGWMYREDYARGGFVILATADPSGAASCRQALLYALVLLPVSLLPTVMGFAGVPYFVTALILGAGYIFAAARTFGPDIDRRMRTLFRYSIIYLPLMLVVIALERLGGTLA
jgi:protoheme IX farnesyltransferase